MRRKISLPILRREWIEAAVRGRGIATRRSTDRMPPRALSQDRTDPHRAVMFVYNTVSRDRRVLKEAESLVRHGWDVTIIGLTLASDPQPLTEVTDSGVVIHRIPLSLAVPHWRRKSALPRVVRKVQHYPGRVRHTVTRGALKARHAVRSYGRRLMLGRFRWSRVVARGVRRGTAMRLSFSVVPRLVARAPRVVGEGGLLVWLLLYVGLDRLTRGELDWLMNAEKRWDDYAARAAAIAPPADVFHGHDLSAVDAALHARARHGRGAVIYDAHELYVESGRLAQASWTLKRILRRRESHAWHRVDAVITVNAGIRDELCRRYGSRDVLILHNCVSVKPLPAENRLRTTLQLPQATPIVLYQGSFTEARGLPLLMRAMNEPPMAEVHLVLMGFGPMFHELQMSAAEHPRVHVLPPVPPGELDEWVAGADVCVMTNQPAGMNEVFSTPNKLFESIAAGVPVVTSDFPLRRSIVLDPVLGPLGSVCDPTDPRAISMAIASLLDGGPEAHAAMRRRCLRAAETRWNWANEERGLLALYHRLGNLELGGRPVTGERAA